MKLLKEESFGVVPLRQDESRWKVLIILHKQGRHWGFPKGKKNPGEDDKQAALRELQEETGLELEKFLQETPLIENYQYRRKGKRITKTVYYFPAIVTGNLKLQPEEVRDGKWVDMNEAPSQLTFNEARKICESITHLLRE